MANGLLHPAHPSSGDGVGLQMQSPGDMTLRSGVIRGYSLISLRPANRRVQPSRYLAAAGPWVAAWLSPPRFGVYLAATAGDRTRALALYEWNAAVSAAFLHDLAHLEVALRNAYDTAITTSIPARQPHWIFNAAYYFPPTMRTAKNGKRYDANQINRDQIARAIAEASAPGPAGAPRAVPTAPPAGKVVAELTFGFWRYLSTTAHHHPLGIPYLHRAFLSGTARPDVDRPIGRLHKLRNRVAHHEPMLTQNLTDRHKDILTIAALIDTELHDYITSASTCPGLITNRP